MKKYLVIAVCILVAACSSDDSDNVSQSNAPNGALIKVEVYFPTTDTSFKTTHSFDSNGRIIKSDYEEVIFNGSTNEYSIIFNYNSSDQIWKTNSINDEEFYFTDNLVSSSTYFAFADTVKRQFSYNTLNQINSIQYLNEDEDEFENKEITYTSTGNIAYTHSMNYENLVEEEYTFEYDTNNNPYNTIYNGQEIKKIFEYNQNNKTKRTYTKNNITKIFTIEYTYNQAGYPLTSNEYMDGELVTQSIFTYQE